MRYEASTRAETRLTFLLAASLLLLLPLISAGQISQAHLVFNPSNEHQEGEPSSAGESSSSSNDNQQQQQFDIQQSPNADGSHTAAAGRLDQSQHRESDSKNVNFELAPLTNDEETRKSGSTLSESSGRHEAPLQTLVNSAYQPRDISQQSGQSPAQAAAKPVVAPKSQAAPAQQNDNQQQQQRAHQQQANNAQSQVQQQQQLQKQQQLKLQKMSESQPQWVISSPEDTTASPFQQQLKQVQKELERLHGRSKENMESFQKQFGSQAPQASTQQQQQQQQQQQPQQPQQQQQQQQQWGTNTPADVSTSSHHQQQATMQSNTQNFNNQATSQRPSYQQQLYQLYSQKMPLVLTSQSMAPIMSQQPLVTPAPMPQPSPPPPPPPMASSMANTLKYQYPPLYYGHNPFIERLKPHSYADDNIVTLNLSHSHIYEIDSEAFVGQRFEYIDLSNNKLGLIHSRSFRIGPNHSKHNTFDPRAAANSSTNGQQKSMIATRRPPPAHPKSVTIDFSHNPAIVALSGAFDHIDVPNCVLNFTNSTVELKFGAFKKYFKEHPGHIIDIESVDCCDQEWLLGYKHNFVAKTYCAHDPNLYLLKVSQQTIIDSCIAYVTSARHSMTMPGSGIIHSLAANAPRNHNNSHNDNQYLTYLILGGTAMILTSLSIYIIFYMFSLKAAFVYQTQLSQTQKN